MSKRLTQKIQEISKEYNHSDDVSYLEELRERISKASLRTKYYDLQTSKEITEFLKKRILDIKTDLATRIGMEREDNLALHARKEENEKLLTFFTKDPQKELEEIEKEVDSFS